MKVALCLSGIVGKVKNIGGGGSVGDDINPAIGHHFWKKALLEHYDVDTFIHCWSPERQQELDALYQPKKTIYQKQIIWKPKSGDWLKEYNYPLSTKDDLLNDRRYKGVWEHYGDDVWDEYRFHAERSRSRWYGRKRVVQIKKEYEEENNFKYDFVIVSRFDLWIDKIFPLKELEKGYFYASQRTNGAILRPDHEYALQDMFFLGDSELIDKFYTLYDYISDYSIEAPKAAWEQMERFIGRDKFKFFPWRLLIEYSLLRWRYSENDLKGYK